MHEMPHSTCAIFSYILVTSQSLSYYHILAVCIHRYRMAKRIHWPSAVDTYRYGRESLFIWISVLVVFIPPYLIWGRRGEIRCKCRFEHVFGPTDTGAKLYLLTLFCIPWITTNLLYMIIFLKIRKSLKRVHTVSHSTVSTIGTATHGVINERPAAASSQQSAPSSSYNAVAAKRVLRTVGYLLLVFNVSCVVTISIVLGTIFHTAIPHIIQSLVLVNNICNPFIYTSTNSTLKKETKRIALEIINSLRCQLPRRTNTSTGEN